MLCFGSFNASSKVPEANEPLLLGSGREGSGRGGVNGVGKRMECFLLLLLTISFVLGRQVSSIHRIYVCI